MSYLILHHYGEKMIVAVDKIEAVYSEYIMYDRNRTHIIIGGNKVICDESVDEVLGYLKTLLEGEKQP